MASKAGVFRFRFLLLTASFAVLTICQQIHRIVQKDGKLIGTNITAKEALANSIGFKDFVLETQPSEKPNELSAKQIDKNLEPSNIPIHLTDSSGSVSAIDYRFLASVWDRNTTYDEILLQAETTPYEKASSSSPKDALQQKLKNSSITVIFHTSPKTASSTLRKACMDTQYDSCNLPHKPGTWPEGYRSPKRLTQLFEQCPATRHFCVKGDIPIIQNYTNFYDTRTFLHMFPFRNYDEWAVSALHQLAFRDARDEKGEEECQHMDTLLDQCLPHRRYELDFAKYTKSILANIIKSFKRVRSSKRKEGVDDRHHMLLYNYVHLDETLAWLSSDDFGVQRLPGTAQQINSVRPDDSCKGEKKMMKKYHDCFSDELAGLH
mmetsp:Transcript_14937/g.32419  ORF Transcript_14937/g.32419 Transcript_14937/m.32419 type:complete len:378 (-) Transcript_14937:2394-3527(-)